MQNFFFDKRRLSMQIVAKRATGVYATCNIFQLSLDVEYHRWWLGMSLLICHSLSLSLSLSSLSLGGGSEETVSWRGGSKRVTVYWFFATTCLPFFSPLLCQSALFLGWEGEGGEGGVEWAPPRKEKKKLGETAMKIFLTCCMYN